MKKKIISGLLAMSLLTTSGSYAFAANLSQTGDKGSTNLTKTVASHITIIIPEAIQIPNYEDTSGKLFDIGVAADSNLDLGLYAKVSLIGDEIVDREGKNNFIEERSIVELNNRGACMYSPLRLTKMDKGGNIHGPKEQQPDDKSLYNVKSGMEVACFKGNDTTGKPEEYGLTKDGYRLYAYRGYMDKGLSNLAGDEAKEIVAGNYEGTVVFQLTIDNTEPKAYGPDNGWEYDVDDMPR